MRSKFITVKGATRVYKKVFCSATGRIGIATLVLRTGSKVYRCSDRREHKIQNRKCRADRALVEQITLTKCSNRVLFKRYFTYNGPEIDLAITFKERVAHQTMSGRERVFEYKVGEIVKPTRTFSNVSKQCASGIHFFYNIEDAINY